jgi:hypothetical protein
MPRLAPTSAHARYQASPAPARLLQEVKGLWRVQWLQLDPATLPPAARLAHARQQIAQLREQLAARADAADRPADTLRPWLLLLPWQEVVEAPEVAELLGHQQPSERQAGLELLATLAAQQPQYLQQVGDGSVSSWLHALGP